MASDLDRRTYDILRLIDADEPIGSIRLVELLQRRGYSVKGRTVRLTLSDLDERGLTTKVPGQGRRLTAAGRAELARGDVAGRLEQVRARIATLTSRVTYDPIEDVGEVAAAMVEVDPGALDRARSVLASLDASPIGPVPVAVEDAEDAVRLSFPSSITIDGVLLSRGIAADLQTAGIVEYEANGTADHGGVIRRYTDAISGERSTMDVVTLLIDAERTNVRAAVEQGEGLLVVDNREFPLTRYEEAQDLAIETRANLGGVVDVCRPRERGPFPLGDPGWDFGSLTYGGPAEAAISLLVEEGLASSWETLYGPVARSEFETPEMLVER